MQPDILKGGGYLAILDCALIFPEEFYFVRKPLGYVIDDLIYSLVEGRRGLFHMSGGTNKMP